MLILTQWMFLRPRRGWRVHLAETARPLKTAVMAAAFMAMMLSAGLILTLVELLERQDAFETVLSIAAGMWILWFLWAIVFYVYWREGDRFTQLRTMAHRLIAGSLLELFVAIGVFVWKPDSRDCWCARGSYAGLVFGSVMIWAFGPGLILLFLQEARSRREPGQREPNPPR